MRVGLDAHAVYWRPTGAGSYVLGLLPELLKLLAPEDEIVLVRAVTDHSPERLAWIRHDRLRTVEARIQGNPLGRLWRFLAFPSIERLSGDLDVCHSLRALLTPSRAPLRIATFHNFPPPDGTVRGRRHSLPRALQRAARQADVLITPSHRTKEKICAGLGVAQEKVQVIPYGTNWRFLQRPKPAEVEDFCARYPFLQEPYLLAMGMAEPRKNYPFLIQAYALARRQEPTLPPLVLLASEGTDSPRIRDEVSQADLDGYVFLVDYVEPEFLQFLYRGAELFLHPASDEGFGLPLLEAAASAIPCLAHPTCGVLEIVSDGTFLPGESAEAWAEKIVDLHSNEALRHESGQRAQRQAEKWTWEESARRHWQVYRGETADATYGGTLVKE